MKSSSLPILAVAIGVFSALIPTTPAAAACRSEVLRQVQALDYGSDALVREFRREFSGHKLCRREVELQRAICALETMADDLRSSVENGETCSCQERIFSSMRRTFCAVESLADELRVCRCFREALCSFDRSMDRMAAIGFEIEHRDSDRRYGYDDRRAPRDYHRPPTREELIIGGILGILGGR